MDVTNLELFLITSLAVNAIPGVDRIIVLTRSIQSGARAGMLTSLGVALATLVHAVLVSAGLYIIIKEDAAILNLIQKVGVIFLFIIGIIILTKAFRYQAITSPNREHRRSFVEGFAIHFFNPLAIVFIISYIPQFILGDHRFIITFVGLSTLSNIIGITMNVVTAVIFGKLQQLPQSTRMAKVAGVLGAVVILCFAGSKFIDLYR